MKKMGRWDDVLSEFEKKKQLKKQASLKLVGKCFEFKAKYNAVDLNYVKILSVSQDGETIGMEFSREKMMSYEWITVIYRELLDDELHNMIEINLDEFNFKVKPFLDKFGFVMKDDKK